MQWIFFKNGKGYSCRPMCTPARIQELQLWALRPAEWVRQSRSVVRTRFVGVWIQSSDLVVLGSGLRIRLPVHFQGLLLLVRSPHLETHSSDSCLLPFLKSMRALSEVKRPSDIEMETWHCGQVLGAPWAAHPRLLVCSHPQQTRREPGFRAVMLMWLVCSQSWRECI